MVSESQKRAIKKYRETHKDALRIYDRNRKAAKRADPEFRARMNSNNYASLAKRREFARLASIYVN